MGTPRDLRALYLDTESECWSTSPTRTPRIIQLGIVDMDLAALRIVRKKCFYIRPEQYEISDFCTELTGITYTDIHRHGRPLADVFRTIANEWGPRNKITFTWGDDESAFVRESTEHPFHFVNLGHLFNMTYGIKGGVALKKACEALGIQEFPGREHDALADAHATALLHLEMLRRARANGPVVNEARRPA